MNSVLGRLPLISDTVEKPPASDIDCPRSPVTAPFIQTQNWVISGSFR